MNIDYKENQNNSILQLSIDSLVVEYLASNPVISRLQVQTLLGTHLKIEAIFLYK